MARRREAVKRETLPDPRYNDITLARFINRIMQRGKKSVAEAIVYGSFDVIKEKIGKDPLETFKAALNNVKPAVETKSRRIGGANYQVPIEVRPKRRESLSIRWLIQYSRERGSEKTMQEKLAAELIDAANSRGATVRKRDDVHRMAEANKAFAHYRW